MINFTRNTVVAPYFYWGEFCCFCSREALYQAIIGSPWGILFSASSVNRLISIHWEFLERLNLLVEYVLPGDYFEHFSDNRLFLCLKPFEFI